MDIPDRESVDVLLTIFRFGAAHPTPAPKHFCQITRTSTIAATDR